MDKIQLIKQEIERLKEHTAKCGYPGQGEFENGNREGRNWACDKLLQFIDSLPEEEPFDYKTLDQAAVQAHIELEECNGLSFVNIFSKGAEWQKQEDVKRIEKFLYDTGQCGVNVGAGDWLVQQFKDRCL